MPVMSSTTASRKRKPFECQRCSQCCQGQGGILLRPDQIGPAAAEIHLTEREFLERYCEPKNGAYSVRCAEDGTCLLLGSQGCRIHEAKPDICRRWPFFEALLKDAGAFEEAKLICPGLDPEASHQEFVAFALQELNKEP
jgi:Fe-S-cluster containining protein